MPESLSSATISKIYKLGQQKPKLSNHQIAAQLGVSHFSAAKFRDSKPAASVAVQGPALEAELLKVLKKRGATVAELAVTTGATRSRVKLTIEEMKARGMMLAENFDGRWEIKPAFAAEAGKAVVVAAKSGHGDGEWSHVFGFITDNHLCNKHSRLDVLDAAYKTYQRMGITTVYNAGNWIDGEARFNKTELITRPGMDSQLDYMIDVYPQAEGITTHYIAGDDHEGWYQQREGVEIGRYLQYRAEDQGRKDLKYLGYGEADVKLTKGSGSAVMRVVHPGGGTGYAVSYTDQKRVESYQGGEKPHIELVGHYHKFNIGYPREVHTVQGGCTCDQTMFMRKKKLQAHVGFSVIKVAQDSRGAVSRFSTEFFPFFDRGYYRNDF